MRKFSILFAFVCVTFVFPAVVSTGWARRRGRRKASTWAQESSGKFPEFTVDVLRKELSAFQSGNGESNVVELAQELKLNTLVELITKARLTVTLSGPGPFTIFGPTDEAFAKLPKEVMESLEKDEKFLTDVLLYHVLGTEVYSNQLHKNELLVPSLLKSTNVRINIYGELVTATGSPISKPDNAATNGVIHVLDRVMFPIPMNDVAILVTSNGNFSTLVNAVKVAGLAETLAGGPYTLFAPTNEAFDKLPPGALERLLKDKEEIIKVLTYHMAEGTIFSAAWKHGDTVTTIEKHDVTIGISSNRISVNKANVIYADATATDGVVHVIDAVLLPPEMVFQLVMA